MPRWRESTDSRSWSRSGRRNFLRMARSGSKGSGTTMLRALLCSLVLTLPVLAQDAPPIRVNVQLVRVLATVTPPSAALVGSLKKETFTVRDNGVAQEISVFERKTDQPLS